MNEKQVGRQRAFEYCMYMIVSSYFEKVTQKSLHQEKKLLLHYKELKQQDQYLMEEQCIHYMEKVKKRIPERVWEQPMDVHLITHLQGEFTEVRFESAPYIMCVKADCSSKKAKIKLVFWQKKGGE